VRIVEINGAHDARDDKQKAAGDGRPADNEFKARGNGGGSSNDIASNDKRTLR
jgi:hypothetical protein